MNPHGLPSRMTVGKLLECLVSKTNSITGTKTHSKLFHNSQEIIEQSEEILKENGFNYRGKDYLICG